METKTSQPENYLILALVLLYPITVLTSFANVFVTPQLALVTVGIGAALIVKSIRSITRNSIAFNAGTFDLPVLLLGAAYIVSSILQTPNKMEAFFLPGNTTMVVAGVLLYFLVNQMPKDQKSWVKYFILVSAALVSVIVLFASTGVLRGIGGLPAYIQSGTFSTLGGPLPALMFLAAVIPLCLSLVISEKEIAQKAFFGVALSLIVLAAAISLFNSLPGKDSSPRLPGMTTSWFVAIDSLKQSPLLGVGPGNYLTAFNRFRPISYSATDLWASRFTSAQSFLLTAITETGLAGAAAALIILYFIINIAKEKLKTTKGLLSEEGAPFMALLILGALLLLFPATPTLIFTFFVLLALVGGSTKVNLGIFSQHHAENAPFAARLPVVIATLPILIGVAFYGYHATNILSADMTYKKALDRVAANDGRGAYDTLQATINKNPYVDRYRITYAQINLALANSLAQKEEISEEDRNTIAQLIQQAIREGKAAVALNPTRAGNWETLASIYRAVMPLAQGADAFAVQTYTQAVALDPLNVNTRIALGGIYYAAKAYENAIDVFKLAVAAKPDYANAHYNLAIAYRDAGNLDRAISEMSQVLSLVSKDSEDFKVATKVLEDLQNKKKAELPESDNLTAPPSGDEPGLNPPLDLPDDAAPPTPEETSTPEPSASPEASPTPVPEP